MRFVYEHTLNYPLKGATGYDCDATLIAIREIEANKEWVAKHCSYNHIEDSWNKFYEECCSTVIKREDLNMRYITDAILFACLEAE